MAVIQSCLFAVDQPHTGGSLNREVFMLGAVVLQIVFLILGAVFVCAETAVVTINSAQLEEVEKKDAKRAAQIAGFKARQERFLTTMQFVSVVCTCLGSACGALVLLEPLEHWLAAGRLLPGTEAVQVLCVAVAALVISVVTMIVGRMIPKRLTAEHAEAAALHLCPVIRVVQALLFPLVWLLMAVSHVFLRLMGVDPHKQLQVTEEQIRLMAESGSQKGTIDSQENEFIQNVFEFNDVSVDEICTHRKDVVCVYADESSEEWEKVIYENRHSFYPVCGEDTDDIVGVLDAREYLRLKDRTREHVMESCVRKPYFVPENMKAASLFSNMKKTGNYFAVAIDEYGGMAGIVTMRNLLELIVGEWKEHDEEPEPSDIEKTGENCWRIQGAASLDEAAEELEIDLPLDEYDTFGGYVLGQLGYVPDDGTQVSLETEELEITVCSIMDHRVEETIVHKKEQVVLE